MRSNNHYQDRTKVILSFLILCIIVRKLQERLAYLADKETATTTYTYSNAGLITEIKDPQNKKITMTYDQAGNLLSTTQPIIGTTTYQTYDYKGNPGKITDPKGQKEGQKGQVYILDRL